MNLMTFNKIFGAACAALLVYLLASYVSNSLFALDEPRQLAYGLEVESPETEAASGGDMAGGGSAGGGGEASLPVLLANASPDAGEKVFRKCAACHKLEEGVNAVGPSLWGVVGRDVQAIGDFNYSGALAEQADVWTFENLFNYLENPKEWAPGTSMSFAGLRKPEDRADVIVYLNKNGSGLPLPEPEAAPAEVAPAETAAAEAAPETAPAEMAEAAPSEETPAETAEAAPAAEAPAETAEAAPAEGAPAQTAEAPVEAEPAQTAEAAPAPAPQPAPQPEPEPELTFAEALAMNDVERGREIFQTCALCHTTEDGKNGIGPHLYGVVGRDIGSGRFYPYSNALANLEGDWTVDRLNEYLAGPAEYVPGVRMAYPGIPSAEERAAVISYLNSLTSDQPATSSAPVAEAAPAPAETAEPPAAEAPAETAEAAPVEAAPAAEPPAESAETAPAEAAPTEMAEAAPAEEAPAETAEAAPAEEAPAETAEAAPAAEAPAETAEAAPAEAAPAETAEAAPAEEAPAEVAEAEPAEQAPAETEVAAAPAPEPAPEPATPASDVSPDFVAAYAAVTAADGEKVFRKCQACHKVEEGKHAVGPSLWGVVGREQASIGDFKYSDALMALNGTWTYKELNEYLEKPRDYAPGTRMAFAGLRDVEDRAAVIKYLNEADGSPIPAP
jgi:cytochrome c2